MSNIWKSELPRVVLLHAYSPRNSGDGLLVELAKNAIIEAFGPSDIRVIASDAEAFEGGQYYQWRAELPGLQRLPRRLAMLATAVFGPTAEIRGLIRDADLVVAVGGGYHRGGSLGSAIKSFGAHYGQLRLAAEAGSKAVYLPQSIGPFRGTYKRAMEKKLSQIRTVYARDDRTQGEFSGVPSIRRMPDMAVLELASRPHVSSKSPDLGGKPIFVAREIENPRGYYKMLDEVAASGQFEWALQSTGGGNDDYPLTRRLSGVEPRPMAVVLSEPRPRIVVSTRLHGALSSMIAGFPAIHLSYERKGWGAFEDLGLGDFVLNARDASMAQIEGLVERIRTNPEEYWDTIEKHRTKICDAKNDLEAVLKTTSAFQPQLP